MEGVGAGVIEGVGVMEGNAVMEGDGDGAHVMEGVGAGVGAHVMEGDGAGVGAHVMDGAIVGDGVMDGIVGNVTIGDILEGVFVTIIVGFFV